MKSLSLLIGGPEGERNRTEVNICDSANRKRNISQANWEVAPLSCSPAAPVGGGSAPSRAFKGNPRADWLGKGHKRVQASAPSL